MISSLVLLAMQARAQFTYFTNNGALTITGYSGPGGTVLIPSCTNGLPVTAIADAAFTVSPDVADVSIPDSITTIGQSAFVGCRLTNLALPTGVTNIGSFAFRSSTLTNISVESGNPAYSSVGGVLFNKDQSRLVQYPGGLAGSYSIPTTVKVIGEGAFDVSPGLASISIPNSVTTIGDLSFDQCTNLASASIGDGVLSIEGAAFSQCVSLTNLTIGNSVVEIGDSAFAGCSALTSVIVPDSVATIGQHAFDSCLSLVSIFFLGDAPGIGYAALASVPATIYYLPGTAGWNSTFGGLLTAPWTLPYPLILTRASGFGVESNQFAFTVSWATNLTVIVEASGELVNPGWQALQTNSLTTGYFWFSDPQWTNYPRRFYRVRSL